jgi:Nitrile hydratase beta subunit
VVSRAIVRPPHRARVNGIHDMGGRHGFGPVVRERDEPVFHAKFERRTFAIVYPSASLFKRVAAA